MAYSSITKPSDYFNTKLYTGDGNSSRSITGVGFAPDMVWLKGRTTTYDHRLVDKLRTGTYPKLLYPNLTTAESEDVNNIGAIGSDGFTVGSGNAVNQNSQTYVSWNWKANGSGSINYDGSITSTVSANQTAGFSIVSYTGTGANATVGHGLGVAPKMVIIKDRGNVVHWLVGGDNIGWTKNLYLSLNSAEQTFNHFQDQSPSSSVVYMTNDAALNGSSRNYIMYCFADVKGYSKFGSYEGNGNANGTFVYTGFKPAWIMTKMSSGVQTWNIFDNRRNGYNPTERNLQANLNNAEDTGRDLDILSNGFKQRNGGAEGNGNNSTYIYMAFAAEPLVANVGQSIPATAR
jgi:hypothetical protein